jgi:spore germination protein GerM
MSPRRRALAAVALAALAVLAAACGIPSDDEPRLLASDTSTTVVAPTSALPGTGNTVIVYLTQGEASEKLVAVPRALDAPPTYTLALRALLSGATAADFDRGYSSDISTDAEMISAELADGTLTIDLNEGFYSRQGELALNSFAQVVLTVTDLDGYSIERVRFLKEGEAIPAFTVAGTQDIVTRADYAALDPKVG